MRRLGDLGISWFGRWFASAAGVWQTFALSVIITGLEVAFPHVDPNGFKWLYLCTVWSFFTQNALAYSSNRDAAKVVAALEAILAGETRIESDLIADLQRRRHHARKQACVEEDPGEEGRTEGRPGA